jgi:two-component system, OmpR family, manganese sensing sensor histidine kinase
MLKKLKNRLIIFYGSSTTAILAIVMVIVFIMNERQEDQYEHNLFQNNVNQTVDQFSDTNTIDTKWLIQFQETNNLLIHIQENGIDVPSYFRIETKKEQSILYDTLTKRAADEGMFVDTYLFNKHNYKSNIYELCSGFEESYLGCVAYMESNNNKRFIYMIKILPQPGLNTLYSLLRYVLLTLTGSAFLFLFSYLFIKKVISPVEEGQQKQVEFIAAASHELRSPLTVIRTGITTMRKNPEKSDSILPYIESESDRMVSLINDLLLLAASDAKTWCVTMDSVDMETLLIEAYDTFCSLYNEQRIPIELELSDNKLPHIMGDPDRIKQVITILMDNALRYTDKEKGILLRAYPSRKRNPSLVIEVIDYGPGIPNEQKQHIFNRFYQADSSRTDKKHYGLGLSIAKELILKHGGTLQVLDTPNGGATFQICLPVLQ